MGLFAGQKWCISGNPGNTLSGHHLSVGNPSVCSQGIPCQVLWSGMLGLGRGGQRQLRFSKAMQYSHRSQTFVSMGPANSVPNTLKVCAATPADLLRAERTEGLTAQFYSITMKFIAKIGLPQLGLCTFSIASPIPLPKGGSKTGPSPQTPGPSPQRPQHYCRHPW